MKVKKYLVKDMSEATTCIRNELGSNAIIISSRWVRKKGLKNLFKRKMLEVTAAVDQQQYPQNLQVQQLPVQHNREIQLENEIKELKDMVNSLIEKDKASKKGRKKIQFSTAMQRHLKEMDADEQIVKDFTTFCRAEGSSSIDFDGAAQYFTTLLERSVLSDKETGERIWAFVGPTGVGKTTTIAKIASKETIVNRKSVGLITTDTFRIGAVDQLKTYADILHIPLEVASSREEIADALEKLHTCDLVLIDSTGRNFQMKDQLIEVKEFLSGINQKHNILVVNASTRNVDLKMILENYKEVGYDSIILTKMDETQCYGSILNINHYSDKPLLYFTTGQIVPEDIKKVTMENLLEYVFMGVDV